MANKMNDDNKLRMTRFERWEIEVLEDMLNYNLTKGGLESWEKEQPGRYKNLVNLHKKLLFTLNKEKDNE